MAFLVFGAMSYAQSMKPAKTALKKEQLKPNAQIKDAKTGAVLKTVKPTKELTFATPVVKKSSNTVKPFSNKSTVVQGSGSPAKSKQVQDIPQPKTFSKEDALKGSNPATKSATKTAKKSGTYSKIQKLTPISSKKLNKINQ